MAPNLEGVTTQSLANPVVQPSDAQLLEQTTIASLRGTQHLDINGNPITDPDLSNPTRPRMERPLDTIRSFEKAIDAGYKRRSSMMRGESYDQSQQHQSRRNSAYGYESNRHSQGGNGYHGNRRSDNYNDVPQQRTRYGSRGGSYNNGNNGYNGNGVYPQHGYHQSHDTVTSGQTYGSDSTGPWANGTDPSSENSSLDRINATNPQQDNVYGGQNGYGGYPRAIPEDGQYNAQHQQGYGGGGPVQPPNGQKKPIALGGGGGESDFAAPPRSNLPSTARPEPEKKKGWLKRRFSKKE
ncbi:hypothetical protein Q7P35_003175 [Cladosporium inversicolor]